MGEEVAGESGALALVRYLRESYHSDSGVRCRVVEAIRQLGHAFSTLLSKSLGRALLDDHNVEVRKCAATALGNLGSSCDDCGISALVRVLKDDSDMGVRTKAADALKLIGAPLEEESQWFLN